MNNQKGQQVFTDNVDDILAEKIVSHTKTSSEEKSSRGTSGPGGGEQPSSEPGWSSKVISGKAKRYGLIALGLLGILAMLTFFLRRLSSKT
jgi:hypothetical protein